MVRAGPSRFGRGFFSSINETVSTTGFALTSGAGAAAEAAAASAAARDLAAGVAATAALRGALMGGPSLAAFAALDFGGGPAGSDGAADLTGLRGVAEDLRAAVLFVVRVGMFFLKIFHGFREATLLCGCFSRHCGMDLLRFRFVHI